MEHPDWLSYDDRLGGMCAIASSHLWFLFQDAGFKPQIALSQNSWNGAHVFVILDNEMWDVTASQFGAKVPDIVCMPAEEAAKARWYWKPLKTFNTPAELRQDQIETGWPSDQTVPVEKARAA